MQFDLRHMMIGVFVIAVFMSGYALGGRVTAVLIVMFLGMAAGCGKMTFDGWPTMTRPEKQVGVFATSVGVLGFVVMFMVLIARSESVSYW